MPPEGRPKPLPDQEEHRPDRLTSRVVARNLVRVRKKVGLTTRELAALLSVRGMPMSSSGITDIERGRRGVSVDQLTALAGALAVSPLALLTPLVEGDDGRADPDAETRLAGVSAQPSRHLAAWLRADRALGDEDMDDYERETYRRRSLPWWYWKRED